MGSQERREIYDFNRGFYFNALQTLLQLISFRHRTHPKSSQNFIKLLNWPECLEKLLYKGGSQERNYMILTAAFIKKFPQNTFHHN